MRPEASHAMRFTAALLAALVALGCGDGAVDTVSDEDSGAPPMGAGGGDGGVVIVDPGLVDAGSMPDAAAAADSLGRTTNMRCPDPGLDYDDGVYYLVCTGQNAHFYTSTDLMAWTGHAMTITFPAWVDVSPGVWAYELEKVGGIWYLYFSAADLGNPAPAGHHRSIGVVEAPAMKAGMTWKAPASLGSSPLVTKKGSSLIDPFVFNDSGALYLFYNQYNSDKSDSGIYVNRLSSPVKKACCQVPLLGASLAQTPKNHGGAWTGATLEAPAVFAMDGFYYLSFSGNLYSGPKYATGLARSKSPMGPYVEAPDDPALDCDRMKKAFGGSCAMGPGGASFAPNRALLFHAQMSGDPGRWAYYAGIEMGPSGWPVVK
jgi:hypothetical protein